MLPTPTSEKALSRGLLDVLIRAGLIAVLAIFCFQIFRPFLDLIVWSVILAVTIYPLQVRLRRRLGNKDGRAATLIVLAAIAIIALPAYLLGAAMVDSMDNAIAIVKTEGIRIPPPHEAVASWPLVGQRLYTSGSKQPRTWPAWCRRWRLRSRTSAWPCWPQPPASARGC